MGDLADLRSLLRAQCSEGWAGAQAFGLEEQMGMLRSLVSGIVLHRRSESALLVGAAGTGKSFALSLVLEEAREFSKVPIKRVDINGLLHNDPRVACEEILFQLDGAEHDFSISSFDEAGDQVLEQLKGRKEVVILILDNLDLFASLQGGKQSLLYFLFDLQHHNEINIGIFGTSTRLDCLSLMEKRVISRFSQIQVRFYAPEDLRQFLLFIQHRLLIAESGSEEDFSPQLQSLIDSHNDNVTVSSKCHSNPHNVSIESI